MARNSRKISVTASWAPSPWARTVMVAPAVAPRPITARIPVASTVLPWCEISSLQGSCAAALASLPAGRACRCAGSTTSISAVSPVCRDVSELGGMAGLLCGVCDSGEVGAAGGRDGGGDGALDERGVHKHHVSLGVVIQHHAGGDDRAAEVGQNDDAAALVGVLHGGGDRVVAGADPAVGRAAGGDHRTRLDTVLL